MIQTKTRPIDRSRPLERASKARPTIKIAAKVDVAITNTPAVGTPLPIGATPSAPPPASARTPRRRRSKAWVLSVLALTALGSSWLMKSSIRDRFAKPAELSSTDLADDVEDKPTPVASAASTAKPAAAVVAAASSSGPAATTAASKQAAPRQAPIAQAYAEAAPPPNVRIIAPLDAAAAPVVAPRPTPVVINATPVQASPPASEGLTAISTPKVASPPQQAVAAPETTAKPALASKPETDPPSGTPMAPKSAPLASTPQIALASPATTTAHGVGGAAMRQESTNGVGGAASRESARGTTRDQAAPNKTIEITSIDDTADLPIPMPNKPSSRPIALEFNEVICFAGCSNHRGEVVFRGPIVELAPRRQRQPGIELVSLGATAERTAPVETSTRVTCLAGCYADASSAGPQAATRPVAIKVSHREQKLAFNDRAPRANVTRAKATQKRKESTQHRKRR